MIKTDEFQRVCKLAKLVEVTASKTFAFKSIEQTEGIELINGKISLFKIITMKDGTKEKVITEDVDSPQIQSVIGAFVKEVRSIEEDRKLRIEMGVIRNDNPKVEPKKEPETKTEDKPNIQNSEENNLTTNAGIMPDTLTDKLFTKWQGLSVAQRLIMLQQTAPQHILKRKGRGGSFKYVDISYMLKCANMAFGFSWDSKVTGWKETSTEIICFGTVEANMDGKRIIKSACGQKDIAFLTGTNTVMCLGDDYKAAQSDMIKKALSQFGIANDVYGGEL